jgi:hypothetical protein
MYPAPAPPAGRTETRSLVSLILGITSLLLAMVGFLMGLAFVLTGLGALLNFLLLGLPAMIAGPVAFFLGRSAVGRIAASPQTLGGRSTAVAGWVIGAVGTAGGAAIFLIWWVLVLLANFGPPPA